LRLIDNRRLQDVDFSRLDVFARVADRGSLSKAAVALSTTSSALSRQMALLEQECGGRLFHRTGRGLVLTELGQRILPRVHALLQDVAQLSDEIKGNAGVPSGEVRLGVLAAPAASLLPPLYVRLRQLHPAVRLRVIEGSTGQMDEWISSGQVDIALVARQGDRVTANEHPMATSHSCLVAAAGDPLVQAPTVEFSALSGLPMVLPGSPNGMRRTLESLMKQRGLCLEVAMEADSLLVQVAMAARGCGYIVLPRHAVADWVAAGTLAASRIVNPGMTRTVALVASTQRPSTLASREVFRLIRLVVEGLTKQGDGVWAPLEA
jgi:LysR family transcriptional regulator, nitrogen assimilation regulatory protein